MNTEQDVTIHQYLKDCGCDEEEIVKYLAYVEQGGIKNQIFILVRHRKRLLNRLHGIQKKLDCTDFIIRQLVQELSAKQ